MGRKVGVVIGRFQGYHAAHQELINHAMDNSDVVIILIGSSNVRSSIKNPFTYFERNILVQSNMPASHIIKSSVFGLNDADSDIDWAQNVKKIISLREKDGDVVTLFGCNKDASTYYLDLFPEWNLQLIENTIDIDSTRIREMWFNSNQASVAMYQCPHITDITYNWFDSRKYSIALQQEWEFYQTEKIRFNDYPYPETLTFNCGDAVIVCHNKVLMITRKFAPGKGCLALPGGFKNSNETFLQTAVREGYEETGIELAEDELMKCLIRTQLFDDPKRSLGIPRATLAAYFDISKSFALGSYPNINPMDDAATAEWIDIDDLDQLSTVIYDDHSHIIRTVIGDQI
jgi:bifunctional NMN adenylyltransferase/nudix hydrolase